MTPFIHDRCGRISWKRMLTNIQPGDVMEFPLRYRHIAPTQIARMGFSIRSHGTKNSVQITFLAQRAESAPPIPNQETIEQRLQRLWNQVSDTKGKIARHKLDANERTTHAGRVQSGALVLLYQSQLRCLMQEITTLTQKQTA